ncbi:PAS domain-containing methyl-accepting chemotaxis protein [Nitrosomonas sp.]|uniref:methyl-accepting chemotaxis protein n=1 Tax=Nitrosomonas sp. TaxID=42353 RepID=UPI001D3B17A3|nr:PAS domain-containing methyl-accepting chemotaxis protein [Nitrosomonas sp.]MCB1950066.1 PAS domain-containing protein [Nitrosomonas sp.]MCP5243276.1 PAS domain-containing protein [Burkholderiales bacterium]MDR4515167.1 methyl-accepting chemotaxis protein [Nitrosomonas sp.]
MRVNLPITDIEYPIDDDTLILSTTDTKGRLTYVNPTFIEVSGFTKEELIGKAHNIVRHPDMPPEAFEDLWKTLKAGLPWTGLVKNRRKNGDFYWVLGNATPLMDNGKITGYLSVRTKPPQGVVEKTAPIYRQLLEGKAKNIKVQKGKIVRTDVVSKIMSCFKMTVSKRIALFAAISALLLLITDGMAWWGITQGTVPSGLSGTLIGLKIGGIALIALMTGYLIKNTISPLRQAINIANTLAAGNLGERISLSNRHDEFSELTNALRQTGINLRATVADVHSNALSVRHAAQDIAAGNWDLSQRTEEQASSLEETSASMEELTSTVNHNTDNARQACHLAVSSGQITQQGDAMMQNAIAKMSSISDSSSQIANIINVINEIAFQTNILALNAAVEAARAGEHGRGFAVVASEVRNLAQRSATAAKDIKSLIDGSIKNVDEGAVLINQMGTTMKEIANSINRVTHVMTEIAEASREQNSGIEQVNQAVAQMDQVTQQNAALVEESAAAADTLRQQAVELEGAISIFKIGQTASNNAGIVRLPSDNADQQDDDYPKTKVA